MNELKKESTSYQKFSSGKSIKYYKNIQSGTNLEPLSYNLTVLHKPSKKLIGGKTIIMIAHRMSTLSLCEKIYRLTEDGLVSVN